MRSTQGLQFNQIQCGKVTGAASPSTLAFTKMIKVDLSPTQVHSSATTFILLLLSIILVKSFFWSVKTHDLLYQRQQLYCVRHTPCLWNYLPEDQLNFQSFWNVCYILPYNMLFWKLEQWIEKEFVHFVYSIQVWQYVNAQSKQTVFQSTARVFRAPSFAISRILIASLCTWWFLCSLIFCATIITEPFLCYHKKWHWPLPIEPK